MPSVFSMSLCSPVSSRASCAWNMAFLFRDGERHGLERMKLDADKHQRHGQREAARPREPRPPGASRREFAGARGATARGRATENLPNTLPGAPARGRFSISIPVQNRSWLVGRAISRAFWPSIGAAARPAVKSRFNFRFAANTRHETVVSEQPKTCAASAWFNPS